VRARRPTLLLALYGLALLRIGTSDRLLFYVRPATRSYVLAAGATLAVVGGAHWLRVGTSRPHDSASPTGWLVLAPVLALSLVPPPTDGAVTGVSRTAPPKRSASVLKPLPQGELVGLHLAEVVQRAAWGPSTLRGRRLRVIGFVAHLGERRYAVARLSITCCAADAQQDEIDVRLAPGRQPPPVHPDQWVAVTGRFVGMSAGESFVPVLVATSIAGVPAPANPYD
jgi:uncharacterized repeat protein (TIGR03943 family)